MELTNDILEDPIWAFDTLYSPNQSLVQAPEYLPSDNHLVKADPLQVHIPSRKDAANGFIDDIITVAIDIPAEIKKDDNADMLAVYVGFRPLNDDDPLQRDDPQSIRKTKAEVRLAEIKIVLG